MKFTTTFQHNTDIKSTIVFNGDITASRAIQGMLAHLGALIQRDNCIIIKHPVTGLECALSPGDTVTWDSEAFRFIVVQNNDKSPQWCRIEFDVLKFQSGTIAAEVHIPCASKAHGTQILNMAAGQPCTVSLRVVTKDNLDGEVVYKGDLPYPKSMVEREALPVLLTYRGHEFRAWSEGIQFVITHNSEFVMDTDGAKVVCQIIII